MTNASPPDPLQHPHHNPVAPDRAEATLSRLLAVIATACCLTLGLRAFQDEKKATPGSSSN